MDLKTLFQKIDSNACVLTANKRLSRFLRHQFNDYQRKQGKQSWETNVFLPFLSWVEQQWHEAQIAGCGTHKILLNSFQESYLWSKIIQSITQKESFALSKLAQKAWGITKSWNISLTHPLFQSSTSENSRFFLRGAEQFSRTCQKNEWIDTASLISEIQPLIISGDIRLPSSLWFVGFLELTPAMKSLISAAQKQGCSVDVIQLEHTGQKVSMQDFSSIQQEMTAMALWAKKQVEANGEHCIACVVPQLGKLRKDLERIFLDTCPSSRWFDISLGTFLSEEPVVYAALYLLRWIHEPLSISEISYLIRSPFLGLSGDQETSKRALLDAFLMGNNQSWYRFEDLLEIIKKRELSSNFQIGLEQVRCLIDKSKGKIQEMRQFSDDWVLWISKVLSAFQWPGSFTKNSREYQALEHWAQVLDVFSSLRLMGVKMSYSEAVRALADLTKTIIFHPQSPESPIQILGVLEAEGLLFSHTWVMDVTDENWPQVGTPNPLLPPALQKEFNTPHSSYAREFQFYHYVFNRLIQSSEQVVFSYSKQEEQCRPSSFLAELSFEQKELLLDLSLSPWPSHNLSLKNDHILPIVPWVDHQAPRVTGDKKVLGGTKIFKLQALCPFRAFAEIRLLAKEEVFPMWGLNFLEKGSLVHESLERIWKEIRTQEQLLKLSDEAIKGKIRQTIDYVFSQFTKEKAISSVFIELEKERFHRLLFKWLALEKERPPFQIYALEQWRTVQIDSLKCSVKVDRMDLEEDRSFTLIDYKTSSTCSPKNWEGDRPDDPQLLLYLVTAEEPIKTLAFGIVHDHFMGFRYMSAHDLNFPGENYVKPHAALSWNECLKSWRKVLEKIATDFREGQAETSPKDKQETCKNCHLRSFCRIDEVYR